LIQDSGDGSSTIFQWCGFAFLDFGGKGTCSDKDIEGKSQVRFMQARNNGGNASRFYRLPLEDLCAMIEMS